VHGSSTDERASEGGSARNATTRPAAAASTTKAPAVILIRLDPSAMKRAAPAITKSPSTSMASLSAPLSSLMS
jgi:hypothetical protein